MGIEPMVSALPMRCFTAKLRQRVQRRRIRSAGATYLFGGRVNGVAGVGSALGLNNETMAATNGDLSVHHVIAGSAEAAA